MGNLKRVEEIRNEHASRVVMIGRADADMELFAALANAEDRYDDFAKKISTLFETTSPRAWLIKFYTEHLAKAQSDHAEGER